jgi:hypothetical protein
MYATTATQIEIANLDSQITRTMGYLDAVKRNSPDNSAAINTLVARLQEYHTQRGQLLSPIADSRRAQLREQGREFQAQPVDRDQEDNVSWWAQ